MSWSAARAQEHLLAREQFGMRLGLERMRALLGELGSPHERVRAIHVVGTNGKSSTTRFAAALLQAHGVRAGAYVSPHLTSFTERVRLDGADCPPDAFAEGVQAAANAAARVERGRADDDRVTQFELLTAAALWIFDRARLGAVVLEAGLGGRLDATNVVSAPVVALTNVDLEHTQWLGETRAEIAREKLAVAGEGSQLVTGVLAPEAAAEAVAHAARMNARLLAVPPHPAAASLPGYQRENFALACAAVEVLLGHIDAHAAAGVAARARVPGRLHVVGERPWVVFDGAHNPAGVRSLVASLRELPGRGDPVVLVGVLDDKDAGAMLAPLLDHARAVVATSPASPRALPASALGDLAVRLAAGTPVEIEPEPRRALERARELAGRDGRVLVCGSLQLVGELLSGPERVAALR